jgi:FtsP/CotA-like multicopper oxidase with cupredoxin domain
MCTGKAKTAASEPDWQESSGNRPRTQMVLILQGISMNMKNTKGKQSNLRRSQVAQACLTVSILLAGGAAHAGAGWADNTDKAGIPFKQATFYASSPAGMLPDASPSAQPGQMRDTGSPIIKFKDSLPLAATTGWLADNNKKGLTGAIGKHIPVAIKESAANKSYKNLDGDYYEIALVEYRDQFHSDLPGLVKGTLPGSNNPTLKGGTQLRGYVQVLTPALIADGVTGTQLFNPNGKPVLDNKGQPVFCVGDAPHYLGPVILSDKGTAVRVKFDNYLATGHYDVATGERNGDSFIPTDLTVPGSGLGPNGAVDPNHPTAFDYYTQNRAMIHLHGGDTPWISDGEPHSWITPAGEVTQYATGATVQNVPDMPNPGPGSQTYYFPNNQSSRMEWYHDHSFAATRLNVAAGEVSAFFITDDVERALKGLPVTDPAVLAASLAPLLAGVDEIPLVFEDKTFVPKDVNIQDAKWSKKAWGEYGDIWFPHVYETNQNPNSIDGTNPAGRWDYGPWFWPVFPAPLALPTGDFDEATGISHASGVQEMFADTPILNGVAYPDLAVQPKTYRFRLLNASEQRYLNLGLYVAEPLSVGVANGGANYSALSSVTFTAGDGAAATGHLAIDGATGTIMAVIIDNIGGGYSTKAPTITINDPTGAGSGAVFAVAINTEVPMVDAVMPPANPAYAVNTYDGRPGGIPNPAAIGPDIVQIANEGGFLATPNVIPSTPVSYQQLRRIVTVLNILDHGLYVGPAERADFLIDFSQFKGKTLIVYNDAPAPNPGFDTRVDYYTGDVDASGSGGTNTTLPGQGPNTRTIMRINVASTLADGVTPAAAPLDTNALATTLPKAFAVGSDKPVVPESWQNAAYGTSYQDNLGRIYAGSVQQQQFTFNIDSGAQLTVNPVIALDSQGVGYTAAPTVQFEGGFDAQYIDPTTGLLNAAGTLAGFKMATAHAVLDAAGGRVSSIVLDTAGLGYTTTPVLNIVGGGGIGAAGTVFMDQPAGGTATLKTVPVLSKGIQELFDPNYGRMNATFSAELPFTAVLNQTTIPLGYIDPPTEAIKDGEYQIWKITHNGVDTHPVHFHLFNVQVINRVGWDGTVVALDPAEFGWKETVKMNPLEDIYVAVKPKSPAAPFGVPQSIRPLDPSQPLGSAEGFSQVDPTTGLATTVINELHNFDWEYVWHCHILGHEENDFMRVISFDFGAKNPTPVTGVTWDNAGKVTWVDPTPATPDASGKPVNAGNKTNEIGFIVLRSDNAGTTFQSLPTIIPQSAAQPGALPNVTLANATGWTDPTATLNPVAASTRYAVYGFNSTGYSTDVAAALAAGQTSFVSDPNASATTSAAAAVNNLGATLGAFDAAAVPTPIANTNQPLGGFPVTLTWSTASQPAGGYVLVRSGGVTQTGTALPNLSVTVAANQLGYLDPAAAQSSTFTYRIKAIDGKGVATASTQVVISTPFATPPDVTGLVGSAVPGGWSLTWDALTVPYFTAYKVTRMEIDPITGLPIASTETAFVLSQFINPLSGVVTAPANTYVDTSLVSGKNYVYLVSAINGNVASTGVSNTANASGGVIAAAPAAFGLAASASTNGQVALSWQAASANAGNVGKVATGYILTRTVIDPTSGLPMTGTTPVTLATPAGVATSFVDSTVADNTTYAYTLTWFNGSKTNLGASVSTKILTPYAVPGAVSALTATAQPTALPVQVLLNWAAAKPATGYLISRCEETTLNAFCTSPNTVWTQVTTLTGATLANSYLDQGVVSNSAYSYRVQAFNGATTNVSATVSVSVATSIPAVSPSLLGATAALDQVTLTWTNPTGPTAASTTTLQVQRSTDATFATGVTTFTVALNGASQSMVDYGPFNSGLTYNYRVIGVAVTRGVTTLATTASNTATAAYIAPAAPIEVATPSFTATNGVIITWAAGAANAGPAVTGYQIYRNGSLVGSALKTATSYTDTTAVVGQTYTYQVVASNGVGSTPAATTTTASLTTQAEPTAVSAALNGTATAAASTATLSWTAPVADSSKPAITSTRVFNTVNGVTTIVPAAPGTGLRATITGSTAAVTGLTAGATYNFTVGTVNSVGTAQSAPAVTVADLVQAAPTMATPTFLTGGQVQLSWTQPASVSPYAVKGYSVYRVAGGNNTLVTTTTTPSILGYTLTLAAGNNTYLVNAYNDAGPSVNSGTVTVNTALPSTPAQNPVSAVTATSATVNWTASTVNGNAAPITGYQVFVGVDGAAPSSVATTGPTAVSQAVTIAAGHSYVFQVKAQSSSGTTVASNSVTLADVAAPALATAVRNAPVATSTTDTVGITWTAQASTSPVTTYNVDYSTSTNFTGNTTTTQTYSGGTLPAAGASTTTTFNAVARGTNAATPTGTVYFRVRAVAAGATVGTSPTLTLLPASLK